MKKVIVAAMLIFGLMVGIVNADVIPLVKGARGNYDIVVTFSDGSRASFLLDTGATTTCLSPETFIRLTSSGKVSMTFLGEGQATLADNSKVTTSHWTLGQVSLSPTVVVRNLEVMIAPSGGSNLLGMNFLSQMGTWSINSSNSTLITGQQTTPPPPSQRQLPSHVEVVDNEGHIRPVKGYIWVDPSSPGSEVIPIPANIDSTSPIYPYDYRPAKGYRWIDSSKPMTVAPQLTVVSAPPLNEAFDRV